MPLKTGNDETVIADNIKTLMAEGYSQTQATAIAYSHAGDEDISARVEDFNGWFEVPRQPISKVGVFDYMGSSLTPDPTGTYELDPNKIYKVYRSAAELSDPEAIESFKLLPWINGHTMIGPEEFDAIPAEQKGIGGVVGERIAFDETDQTLYGNIKCFSEAHRGIITSGKKDLSLGYRCQYLWEPGEVDGVKYDVVQCTLRGNHLASVDNGRMGPTVAVLDHNDIGIEPMDEIKKLLAALLAAFEKLESTEPTDVVVDSDDADKAAKDGDDAATGDKPATDGDDADKAATDAKDADDVPTDGTTDAKDADDVPTDADKDKPKPTAAAMDEAAVTTRVLGTLQDVGRGAALAAKLKPFVGAFDHSAKTERQVAAYGCKKLGLQVAAGMEVAAVAGYLKGRAVPGRAPTARAMDGDEAAPAAWLHDQIKTEGV